MFGPVKYRLNIGCFFCEGTYEVENDLHLNMNGHATLKAVFKYKNHPSIISIICFRCQVSNFIFSCIDNTVLKEIRGLITTKASQDTDLPGQYLKEMEIIL